jgi:hypothetical protein
VPIHINFAKLTKEVYMSTNMFQMLVVIELSVMLIFMLMILGAVMAKVED